MTSNAREREAPPSPWYFRQRFMLFGLAYFAGFFLGYVISGFVGDLRSSYAVAGTAWFGSERAGLALAAALALFGYAWRVWGSSELTGAIVWAGDVQTSSLRVAGPYRFTRNPLYLGNLFVALGVGMLAPWPATALVFAGNLILCVALIHAEECSLEAVQGEAYGRYAAAVPQLLPVFFRSAPATGAAGSLATGFRAEMMMGAFASAMLVSLAVGRPIWWVFTGIFLVTLAGSRATRGRPNAS